MTQNLDSYLNLIRKNIHTQKSIKVFKSLFDTYSSPAKQPINLNDYAPCLSPKTYQELKESTQKYHSKVAIVKLNGGLGTSLNCHQTKSLIPLHKETCLLDYFFKQLSQFPKNECPPIILMNSYYTHQETRRFLEKYKHIPVQLLEQSRYPRLEKNTLTPYQDQDDPNKNWAPPGHGELFDLLYESGTLSKLLSEGKDYLFISNSDNLAGTYSNRILDHIISNKIDFLMETTPKTKADIKGGVLVQNKTQIKLIEIAQITKDQHPEFFNLEKFKLFNTNNLWVNISSLIKTIEANKLILDPIFNQKIINQTPIIQFETAMGSAIQSFDKASILTVPRSRFLPIKTVNDVMLLLSDIYTIEEGFIKKTTKNDSPEINIENACKSIQDFQEKFTKIPSLIECSKFYLKGPCSCHHPTKIKGHVKITCNTPYDISNKEHYENCALSI